MMRVYDMDGVLIETKIANMQAYWACGVLPPEDHHVRPWQEWCTPEQHEAKAKEFPRMLELYGRELEHLDHALLCTDPVVVLTNASTKSLDACRAAFPKLRQLPTLWDMKPADKLEWLRARSRGWRVRFGIYYDDNPAMIARVEQELGQTWHAVLVR